MREYNGGEMKGDFSRFTFDPKKHFNRVLMQQGRVQLDTDWNEQADMLQYYLETHLKDIIGSAGAPQPTAGFKIRMHHDASDASHTHGEQSAQQRQPFDFSISPGRYYVNGILCENEEEVFFSTQPDYPQPVFPAKLEHACLIYLDVWQRHITAFEDPSLREVALGGRDTTTRVKRIWQVKLLPLHEFHPANGVEQVTHEEITRLREWHDLTHQHAHKGMLAARCVPNSATLDNQLYRVEIHRATDEATTFKWSRENGSIAFEVDKIQLYEKIDRDTAQCSVTLSDAGWNGTQLQKGDWLEFVDNTTLLHNRTLPLYVVTHSPDSTHGHIMLAGRHSRTLEELAKGGSTNLLLRRWDHNPANSASQSSGVITVQKDTWLDLEYGIQVRFSAGDGYEVGDYWLIPARSLPDNIEWPTDKDGPLPLPPHGTDHHYSPLALLHRHEHTWKVAKDLRQLFAPAPVLTARVKEPRVIETEEIIEEVVERNVLYEECTSEDELALGDLVSLVPHTHLQVTKANRENARLVFGIVSGERETDGQKRFRVTIYGRAQCKISGSIEAGDLLTVAERSGHATKTGHAHEFFSPGALIGKALASHESEESEESHMIEVMVTLH